MVWGDQCCIWLIKREATCKRDLCHFLNGIVRSGLPHRNDVTESPLVRGLVAEAEEIGDLRVVRFFLKIWPTEMFFGVKFKNG